MSVMNKQIYTALIEAGASQDNAASAAESVADYQKDISGINEKLALIIGEQKVIKWGIGLVIAVNVLPVLKDFFI
jgi:hypothetical protein|tara:strand:+ start:630 stop:854 length:225 start_codon:yes stop_codon:yes gene_type:complete